MNRENIIRMAREVGGLDLASHGWTTWVGTQSTEFLERFAALVASVEREACAKICEEHSTWTGRMCAETIKARG